MSNQQIPEYNIMFLDWQRNNPKNMIIFILIEMEVQIGKIRESANQFAKKPWIFDICILLYNYVAVSDLLCLF